MTLSVSEIAVKLQCKVIGDNSKQITGAATLKDAQVNDIAFFANYKYRKELENTRAGACFIRAADANLLPDNVVQLICDDPHLAYAKLLDMLYIDTNTTHYKKKLQSLNAIARTAHISSSATVGVNCVIEHNAVIEDNVTIGDNCMVGSCVYIGENVTIGSNTYISPNTTLVCCSIGENCIIHHGVRIGQDGFGFILNEKQQIQKIQQIGRVMVHNNVEIGANSCIDRGAVGDTIIGAGTKIDNLVQIGHNVRMGRNCIVCGQVGIAGSAAIGDYVMIGGQAGIVGHLSIGNMAKIAARSMVMEDILDGETVGGFPAVKIVQWHKQTLFLRNLHR